MSYSISDINQMNESEFVELLGPVFEETPEIAQQAWANNPFLDIDDLHQKMVRVVEKKFASPEKIALIQSHPELGAKGKMAAASVREQANVGLTQTNAESYQQILELNAQYREKFGYPFVMAVKGQTLAAIAAALENRLSHPKDDEIARSLSEIYKIARFRLDDIITESEK